MRKKKTRSIRVRCGHGNIARVGKSYRARLMVDGKMVSQNCPTEDAAQVFLEGVVKRTLHYGMPLDKTKITWKELAQSFIQAKELQDVKKTTLSDYRRCLKYCAEWDEIPASQITPDHVRNLLAKLKKGIGTRTPLGGKTLNNHFSTIHAILDQGVRDQILERNVADLVDRPKIGPVSPNALEISEIERFLKALEGERTDALFWVILATGLRKGEAVGLKWDDVNLETGVITVKRRLVRVDGAIDIDTPKSRAGMRTVKLPVQALQKLKAWRIRQEVDKNAYGSTWRNEGWIFTTPKGGRYAGKYLEPRTVNDYLDQILAKAELPHATVHDLRHTFCTWLLS